MNERTRFRYTPWQLLIAAFALWTLTIFAVAGHGLYLRLQASAELRLLFARHPSLWADFASFMLVGISSSVLALLLAWRAHTRQDARVLAPLLLLAANAWIRPFQAPTLDLASLLSQYPSPTWFRISWATDTAVTVIILGLMLRFSQVFPHSLEAAQFRSRKLAATERVARALLSPRRLVSWLLVAAITYYTLRYVVFAGLANLIAGRQFWAVPWARNVWVFLGPLALSPGQLADGIVTGVGLLAVLAATACSAYYLRLNYLAADEAGRRQIAWVALAAVFVVLYCSWIIIGMVLHAEWVGFVRNERNYLFLVVLACLSVAVLYYGAFDPRLAVRRTLLYGGLSILAIFSYAAIESLVQLLIARGTPQVRLPSWLSAGLSAVVVLSVRKSLSALLEKARIRMTRAAAPLTAEPAPASVKTPDMA